MTIRPNFFLKKIIGLIQIFEGANSYFCRLNYIYIYILGLYLPFLSPFFFFFWENS